ncbi:MAG: 3-isopropylmalate dehydrogenase, partial [Ruminiclostridium sp.]|nr:3-isopropylmalate dehydrogenase [Ruminiclostridium sp.]
MKKYNIGVIAGDGTGPEVVEESVKVLKAAGSKFGFSMDLEKLDFNGTRYLKTGVVLEDSDIDRVRTKDAILLGAIGHPNVKPGILEKGILLKLRFSLDQYIYLRPVKLFEGVV